eukprot:5403575-Pyramimonas_sp.AAC.1
MPKHRSPTTRRGRVVMVVRISLPAASTLPPDMESLAHDAGRETASRLQDVVTPRAGVEAHPH